MTTQKFRKREKEVIEYLLEGKSNKQISQIPTQNPTKVP